MLGWPLLAMAVGIWFWRLSARCCGTPQPGRSTGSIALSVLAIVYAGLLLSFLVNLRLLNGHRWGMAALFH